MTESELTQILQERLSYCKAKVVVRQRGPHLHILLTRPDTVTLNYPVVSNDIHNHLRSLTISDIDEFTVYGRISGQRTNYEWQQTYTLAVEEEESYPTMMAPYDDDDPIRELEQMEDIEDEKPTELYYPGQNPDVDRIGQTLVYSSDEMAQIRAQIDSSEETSERNDDTWVPIPEQPAIVTSDPEAASSLPATLPPDAEPSSPAPSTEATTSGSPRQSRQQTQIIVGVAAAVIVAVIVIILATR